jgi:hypothetical protein
VARSPFPMLWALGAEPLGGGVHSAGYFLAASRGLPQGVATFYASDLWPGLLLWLVASGSGFVAVHTALWTRCGNLAAGALFRGRPSDGTPAVRHYRVGAPRHCGGCAVSGMGRARSCRHDDRPHGPRVPIWTGCRSGLGRPLALVRCFVDRSQRSRDMAWRRPGNGGFARKRSRSPAPA